ncbi:homoserine O-acetyltransferase [bacterium]|nr:homoserine O-acetyltransferase [bacterium]
MKASSVGIVKTEYFQLDKELVLDSGKKLGSITVAYETYGSLNSSKDNVIVVLHALSGDAHAAGKHSKDDKKFGWWDDMIGPGRALDTNKYFVVCSNFLGGCSGTTGPNSINPQTNKPYGLKFPVITISDMTRVQKALLDYLGVKKVLNVIGGSMGGMQAMDWIIQYPDMVKSAIVIAAAARLSAEAIAFDAVGRNAIMSDPNWNNGDYYDKEVPGSGLAIARMIGHITYLSREAMHDKFGRKLQDKEHFGYDFSKDFQVESYLDYQGLRFVERFDANSYLYITKAMDYFDLTDKYGSLEKAFENIKSKVLVLSYSSDWLFPPIQSEEIVDALTRLDKDVSYCNLESSKGHDAFLLEYAEQSKIVSGFIEKKF